MGALLRLELHGFPHPVAELAATVGGYRADFFPATVEGLSPKPLESENVVFPFLFEELTRDSDVFQDADLSA